MSRLIEPITLLSPKITINWNVTEEELIKSLDLEKNNELFYNFDATMENIEVEFFVRVTFNNSMFKLELCIFDDNQVIDNESNSLFIDLGKASVFENFVQKNYGKPSFFTRLFPK